MWQTNVNSSLQWTSASFPSHAPLVFGKAKVSRKLPLMAHLETRHLRFQIRRDIDHKDRRLTILQMPIQFGILLIHARQ